jgi:glucose/mannose-6-phosphate isomerase
MVAVVFLRDRDDHPQVQRRFAFTRDLVESRAAAVQEVWSEGDSRLARIFSVISLGDYVSLYLAYLNSENPTPVEAIESLKTRLAP